jgi:thioredoxin 1
MIIKKDFEAVSSFEEFTSANTIILFDFYADWCEPCKMLDEILSEVNKDLTADVLICKIDIDKNPALQKHFAIMSVPTLMIFKEGNMEWRMPGFELAQDLKKRLEAFLY